MDLGEVLRGIDLSVGELANIAKEDQERTKKVLRMASDCEGVRLKLSGTHETNVHIDETTRKSFSTRGQVNLAIFRTEYYMSRTPRRPVGCVAGSEIHSLYEIERTSVDDFSSYFTCPTQFVGFIYRQASDDYVSRIFSLCVVSSIFNPHCAVLSTSISPHDGLMQGLSLGSPTSQPIEEARSGVYSGLGAYSVEKR